MIDESEFERPGPNDYLLVEDLHHLAFRPAVEVLHFFTGLMMEGVRIVQVAPELKVLDILGLAVRMQAIDLQEPPEILPIIMRLTPHVHLFTMRANSEGAICDCATFLERITEEERDIQDRLDYVRRFVRRRGMTEHRQDLILAYTAKLREVGEEVTAKMRGYRSSPCEANG